MRKLRYRVVLAGMCALCAVACDRSINVSDYRFDVVPQIRWDQNEMKYFLELSLKKGMDKETYDFEWLIDGNRSLALMDIDGNQLPSVTTVSFRNSAKVTYWMPDFSEPGDHKLKARFCVGDTERVYDWTFSVQYTGRERYAIGARMQDGSFSGGRTLILSHPLGTPDHSFRVRFFIDGNSSDVQYGPQTIPAGSALSVNFRDVSEYRIILPTLSTGEHSVSMSVEDRWGSMTSGISMTEDDVYTLTIVPTVNSDGSVTMAVSNPAGAMNRTFTASFDLSVAQGAMGACNGIMCEGVTLEGNSMKMNFFEKPYYTLTIPSSMLRPASYRFRITLRDEYGQGESYVSWTISADQTGLVALVFSYDQKSHRLMVSSDTNTARRSFTITSMTVGCKGQLTYNPDNWIGRGDEKTVYYSAVEKTLGAFTFEPKSSAMWVDRTNEDGSMGLLKMQMDEINSNSRTHQPKGSARKYSKHAAPTVLLISMYMQASEESAGLIPVSVTFPSQITYEFVDGNNERVKTAVAIDLTINGKKPDQIDKL